MTDDNILPFDDFDDEDLAERCPDDPIQCELFEPDLSDMADGSVECKRCGMFIDADIYKNYVKGLSNARWSK